MILKITVPRESENSPEQTAQLLASLAKATKKAGFIDRLRNNKDLTIALEVANVNGVIEFFVIAPDSLLTFVKSQIFATYHDAVIDEVADYLTTKNNLHVLPVAQSYAAYFPLRDYADYKEVDPSLPVLGVLAKLKPEDFACVQFVLSPSPKSVLAAATAYITPRFENTPDGKVIRELPAEEKAIIKDKISHPLVGVSIRLLANQKTILNDLLGALAVLNRPDGNSLVQAKSSFFTSSSKLLELSLTRQAAAKPSVLNVMELASLWHLPGVQTKILNISWAVSVAVSEAPENLPTLTESTSPSVPLLSLGEGSRSKGEVNIFASTILHNQTVKFGIKTDDRLRHMYVLGKSGTGKSTMLENMAINDFKAGVGVAFIDPHGDSADNLLNYIPSSRINDVIYFNPSDREHPIAINILEVTNPDQAEQVVSGIISIFHKLYGKFWGPRMQYIMRNALLTLTAVPGSTLPDVIKVLSDKAYRQNLYTKLNNPQLVNFWQKEFDTLDDKTRLEYTYPILNKIGQFVNSPLIQGVITPKTSSVHIEDIMAEGKIFIANLSQGKLGEDNATLLGAMLITKFELATMGRITTLAANRKEFFLYVDEFQNFATGSFIKILSEARKFKLGLTLANQYVAQIPEDIQKAIFGNIGTLISFVTGGDDAKLIAKELTPVFDETSLVNLQKHQIAMKMTIDGAMSRPFSAFTLPPLKSSNKNKETVIDQSRRRWARKI